MPIQPQIIPQPLTIYPNYYNWYWPYPAGYEDILNGGGKVPTSEPIIDDTTKKPIKKTTKRTTKNPTKTPSIPPIILAPITLSPIILPPITLPPITNPPITFPPTNATTPKTPVTTDELSLTYCVQRILLNIIF